MSYNHTLKFLPTNAENKFKLKIRWCILGGFEINRLLLAIIFEFNLIPTAINVIVSLVVMFLMFCNIFGHIFSLIFLLEASFGNLVLVSCVL